jgi:Flp pilus assembly protein TadD
MGQFDTAIDDYNSALRFEPKLASALYGRGIAKLKRGDKIGSDSDISAAKTIHATIADEFTHYGVQ